MDKRLFTVALNEEIAPGVFRLEIESEDPAFLIHGEFVNLGIDGFYLRRPLSVCDREPGRITLIYKVVGQGTRALSALGPGAVLSLLTGLGRGFDPAACTASALLVGGGLGTPPLYALAKELKANGKKVTAVLGFNGVEDMILVDDFRQVCDEVVVSTVDGSYGIKGFVTDAIDTLKPSFDYFYTCGPMIMMKVVCGKLEASGEASLEERMGCGAGFCYCCSIQTVNGPRRVCKDGPVFKKEEIIW